MNRTNNRVESINQKLKMVISRYSGITLFFRDLMRCLTCLNIERDHRALDVTLKRRVSINHSDLAVSQYCYFSHHTLLTFLKLKRICQVESP